VLKGAFTVNLLQTETALRYERDAAAFRFEVLAQPRSEWIVIDEVQRAPALLDEVHYLMEEERYSRFALTGSSARKVKRGAPNLLAGRAVMREFFPLSAYEMDFSIPAEQRLKFGSMPLSVTAPDNEARMSHRQSPIWNIVLQYLEGYRKSMLDIGDRRWLIADIGSAETVVGCHRPPLQFRGNEYVAVGPAA
jgi:predicted AAA+ superfamily ATPase